MSRKKFINRSESDELIEDLTLNPYEVNESFRRGIQNEGDEYLEKIEKMVMAEKDINKNNRNFIKFFDNLNRKVHKNDSPIEILTECEKFGFDTETLLRLGTIVIESSPKLPEIQISRGISDKSDERYADDDFEEYTGDDVTEDVELPRAKTAQSIVPPPEVKPKGPRIHSAPVALVTPLNINHFPTESNSSSQVKVNHKQAGWIKRGEWRIGTRIGSGSFGEVFQGMSDDGLLFAVKKLSLVPNKEIANLASEIELMRVLDHPNIVKYLGVKVTRNTLKLS